MYRHQDAEHQFQLSAGPGSSPFSQPQFASPVYGLDQALQSGPDHLHPGARPARTRPSSSQLRQSSREPTASMQPPTSISPRSNTVTPVQGAGSGFRPRDRSLPSRDVTADNITNAFNDFILYCNPSFPLDIDTTTLTTTFQTPPKSDNKDFEIFRLFELIRKFDAKEIKTWGQLALDLGVEAPDTSKGQSVQKVQQYSVRLKRWMRAMHIDAFFEYLLGKQHSYFVDIPPPSDPYPPNGRDGVPAEEDLAIRALDPTFRPKRGRRRNSETEQEEDSGSASKQPRLMDSAAAYSGAPMSAIPLSAHPDGGFNDPWAVASAVTPQSFAPWSGRPSAPPSAVTGLSLRWQLGHSQTPGTPHPMSAMSTSMSAHIDAAFDGEPRSAVTPSSRRRRKHGPAVSSAWTSTSAPGAKPRGRPPTNRNVQDGPFGTFPADPSNDRIRGQALPTPVSTTTECKPDVEDTPQPAPPPFQIEGRPHRLSLQVPPHTGGPVRLATPPTVLVNGETNELSSKSDSDDHARPCQRTLPVAANSTSSGHVRDQPTTTTTTSFSFEKLKRVVASDLIRADIIGRPRRLTGDEGKRLADAVLDRLGVPRAASSENNPRDELARLTAASWLGVGNQFNVPLGPSAGHGKRITVTRFHEDAEGYEEIVSDDSVLDDDVVCRELYDLYWNVSQGGCTGAFEMKGLTLGPPSAAAAPESTHDLILRKCLEAVNQTDVLGWAQDGLQEVAQSVRRAPRSSSAADDDLDWKAKFKAMQFACNIARGEAERLQQRLMEKVLDVFL